MCGLAGYLCRDPRRGAPVELVARMTQALAHRGPDAQGTHVVGPLALGHARLAILDLRPEANQPMLSADGQVALVLNGEIYNYRELAAELGARGVSLRTRSDTEVLLELYRQRGPDCVTALQGMFAFALWDAREQRLLLARDRVGKKPLYYFDGLRGLSFASEVQALLCDPDLPREVDPEGLHLYLTLGYVPSRVSTFRQVRKVPPATVLLFEGERRLSRRYWRLAFGPEDRRPARALADELRERLSVAVTRRLVSDVPLGAFLSGGIDSSAVVGLMAQASTRPVKTFSIGFEEQDHSEVRFARQVARRFGTEHHEELVRVDAAELLPELAHRYGEPFADPSALPTYCLARLTRKHVTVALSGDGGDEVLAGYTRYAHEQGAALFDRLPRGLAHGVAQAVSRLPAGGGRLGEAVASLRQHARTLQLPGLTRYAARFGNLATPLLRGLYGPELRRAALLDAEALFAEVLAGGTARHPVDRLLELDVETYLPDDIFVKVDIASMAHALEVRAPFVDHELMEFCARLPVRLKLRAFRGKLLLRRALADLLPRAVLHRRKRGFSIPHSRWLRGRMRPMLEELVLGPRALSRGYFDAPALRRLVTDHLAGTEDHGLRLWNLMVLELWHRAFIDAPAPRAELPSRPLQVAP
ncbi:MAG: asparagine synthase (glutamine-hydrolyzing) [Deltaproteobacteria bacterium]|nr:asparagine synthase (glutamine-hydrolyzing) [Deltaproteobacteria bacterium]